MEPRLIIGAIVIFGCFFLAPNCAAHLRKQGVVYLPETAAAVLLPIVAVFAMASGDPFGIMFGLSSTAGYFLGVWFWKRRS